jgi:hypothetical protein
VGELVQVHTSFCSRGVYTTLDYWQVKFPAYLQSLRECTAVRPPVHSNAHASPTATALCERVPLQCRASCTATVACLICHWCYVVLLGLGSYTTVPAGLNSSKCFFSKTRILVLVVLAISMSVKRAPLAHYFISTRKYYSRTFCTH